MPSVSGNVGAVASVSSVFGRNGGVVAANGDYSGVVAAHLTGATAATRYVGGTASGAPVAGTFAVGDFVIEQTGKVYVCTVAGTPGTWVAPGGSIPARNVGQTELDFNGLVVNNAVVPIPFVFGGGDASMIDLSNPAAPLPIEAGIYAYTLVVNQDGGGDGGAFIAALTIDDDFYSITPTAGHETRATSSGRSGSAVSIAATWFCTAGSPFHANITEGGASDTYHGNLYVQKIR